MKTENELIAEFDGWTHFPTPKAKGKGYWSYPSRGYAHFGSDAFRYDTSWDWLMPVVEKIGNLNMQYEFGLATHYSAPNPFGPIEGFYQYVVEFIRWYNQIEKEK